MLNGNGRVEGAAYMREGDIAHKLDTALCAHVCVCVSREGEREREREREKERE